MASDNPSEEVRAEEPPYPSARYAWYVVGVLMLIYIFSFVDRQILNLLVDPIKRDLGISETQMSLLMGFSFAVFYTFFGLPIGRLADRWSRRSIIAIGLVLWSITTAGCGLAQRYWHFLLLRMGVGVGEAALSPSAYSLIADYFPKEKLATAISVYGMGIYIGSGLANLLGAVIVGFASGEDLWSLPIVGDIRPWQVVFLAVGLPGIVLTGLLLTVKEPFRRGTKRIRAADGTMTAAVVPVREVVSYIKSNWTTFLTHNVGFAFLAFSSYGTGAWIPTFLMRNHEWSASKAGAWYGTMIIFGGTMGIVVGGRIADALAKRGSRCSKVQAGIIASLAWIPFGVAYPLVESDALLIPLLFATVFTASMPFGAAPAAIQEMMPPQMRASASALYLFVVNLIGLGIGPTAVAVMTQYVFKDDMAVRYSLLIVGLIAHLGAALFLWYGQKPYTRSMDRLEAWNKANG